MAFVKMESGKLGKLIASVGKIGSVFNAKVQAAVVQCIAYSILDRNITPAQHLLDAMSKSTRKDALVAHLELYGNIAYLSKEKKLAFFDAGKVWDDAYAEKVASAIWYNSKPETAIKSVYDAEKEIAGVLDRLAKASTKGGVEVKNTALLVHMQDAYRRFQFDQFKVGKVDLSAQEIAQAASEARAEQAARDEVDSWNSVTLQDAVAPLAIAA